jgi:hypothetical protein
MIPDYLLVLVDLRYLLAMDLVDLSLLVDLRYLLEMDPVLL